MLNQLPKISYCIITYNEGERIRECLTSVFNQNYPRNKLEVILVDDNSTDNTVAIAKQFPVKILFNGKRQPDISVMIGLKNATGDLYTGIGADMQFHGKNWFLKMVKPFMENPDIPAVFTKYYNHKNDSLITKYLNLDPIQRDLVFRTFSPGFDEVITQKKNGYYICTYSVGKIPTQTHGLYRVSVLKKIIGKESLYHDMNTLVKLVENGYTKFGYVPSAGYYHFHADNLKHLLSKRVRNLKRSYLEFYTKPSHYKWFDSSKKKDVLKLILLVCSTYLILPLCLFSLFNVITKRSWLYLLEPLITFAIVNALLVTLLQEKRGRDFILHTITNLPYTKKQLVYD